jgi:hypothetical protein
VGALPETPPIRAVLEYARSLGIRIVRRADGESFEFGGMRVSVFTPPTEWQTSTQPRNNDSLVMRLQYKGSSVLREGDAERVIEQRMMAEYGEVPDDDLTAHPARDVGQQAPEKLVTAKFANTGREGRQDNLIQEPGGVLPSAHPTSRRTRGTRTRSGIHCGRIC